MKLKVWVTLALVVLCCALPSFAQQQKEMSAEEKAMMDAWMKYATPGEAHKMLGNMVGTFDTKVTSWMQPGEPPMVSTGVSENKWVLGGRYIQQSFTGSFMGQPFEGI